MPTVSAGARRFRCLPRCTLGSITGRGHPGIVFDLNEGTVAALLVPQRTDSAQCACSPWSDVSDFFAPPTASTQARIAARS